MVARLWYGLTVALCVFDLDHTLIQTPLDLAAMAVDMRTLIEGANGSLPPRNERYRVGELIAYCRAQTPALEAAVWEVALDHERRAMEVAALEPGALAAVAGARRGGFATAIWTNNARELTLPALERLGLAGELDLVVTRDDMRALKPDPDGWRVISEYFGGRLAGGAGSAPTATHSGDPHDAVVVGDSWVDGVAAAKAGVPFIAYRAQQEDLDRWHVTPIAHLADLALLPAWLETRGNGRP
ncbi:MAG TPA: HAD family hydrolase [Candidatus Binatia bacterium]|nr:HAD family hydrolase [Candidatus Binatia bacterium]